MALRDLVIRSHVIPPRQQMDNWIFCIDEALRKSGEEVRDRPYTREDLGFLNMVLIKPSAYRDMLQRLGLSEEQSIYNAGIGHVGEQDSIVNIVRGLEQGRLWDGDLMAIVGVGIGYVWGAACVQWGEMDERPMTKDERRTTNSSFVIA
jgi:3-oxoacyl-[acyl-carrier-protein] synthase-3